jgi:hypothetical protein
MSPGQRGYAECTRCGQVKAGELTGKGSAAAEFMCDDCKRVAGGKAKKSSTGTRRRATAKKGR